jgi:hypothetical protein
MNVRTFYVGALLVAGVIPLAVQWFTAGVRPIASPGSRSVTADQDAPVRVDWPTHFRDQPLTQLPLSELELRFTQRFPGAVARFTDGERIVILRQVNRPTRQLHPARDCFAALGYRIDRPRVSTDAEGNAWSCFSAERDGRRMRVCERIHDGDGRSWTDVSSWFWSAQYGGGPWLAMTVVEPTP